MNQYDIAVCYLMRDNPALPSWVADSPLARPWLISQAGSVVSVSKWDESLLGPRKTIAELVALSPVAEPWWTDYQRTHKADLQDEVVKAAVLVILDDRNATAQWLTDFKAAVAAATSLADLKTRVAALPACPQRTPEQIKAAIKAELTK